jgi:alpha/beta superfamily hydrolase
VSKVQSVFFTGPAGRLEGILKYYDGIESGKLAVVCHPHPLYQGTMHNKVVFAVATALFEAGCNVLRFNFRGVGLSAGSHDKGRGEIEDTLAAVRFLKERYLVQPCLVAGFSFGAWMALEAALRDSTLISVIAVSPPLKYFHAAVLAKLTVPKLLLQGTDDRICVPEAVQSLYPSVADPKELVLLEGAGHFFDGHLTKLKTEIMARRKFLGIL